MTNRNQTERARDARKRENPKRVHKQAHAPYHADAFRGGRRLQLKVPVAAPVLGARNAHRLLDREKDGGGEKQRRLADGLQ